MTDQAWNDRSEAVRAHLDQLLVSPELHTSTRNRAFLRYVVEQTLNGKSDHIKAYNIATTAFGRGPDFDPQQDAIVRIEAGRLRRALEHYYLTSGAHDAVRITIPVGSYVPVIEFSDAGISGVASFAAPIGVDRRDFDAQTVTVWVKNFEPEGDQSDFPNMTRGFTRQIVVGLARFSDVGVFCPEAFASGDSVTEALKAPKAAGINYVLLGGTTLSQRHFGAEAMLLDAGSGRCVWAQSYNRSVTDGGMFQARDEVAEKIAGTLAQPYGILFALRAARSEASTVCKDAEPDHIQGFYKYWRSFDNELLKPVVADLEVVVSKEPQNAEALAALSLAISNTVRFGPHSRSESAVVLRRAQELARRAIGLRPQSSRGYFALATCSWFLGDVSGCLEALKSALAHNPNDTEVIAELGMRYSVLADWEHAVPLLQDAYNRNPALSGAFRLGLSMWHYAHGRYQDAYAEASAMNTPDLLYHDVLRAISAAKLGLKDEATAAVERIIARFPDYGSQVAEDLSFRNVEPELARLFIAGLSEAGLPQPAATACRPMQRAITG